MISITEYTAKTSPGKTSLYVQFDYNQQIIDIIKGAENYSYNKNTHEWELPLSKLSYLINNLTYIDDIQLNLFPEEEKEKIVPKLSHKLNPYDYQQEGIEWLINTNNGLLTDEPGLGKSLQIIYAAEELHAIGKVEHCLIICGINTLKQNWKSEIQKCSNLSCRVIGERINSNGNISYASVKERANELYNLINEFFVIINVESIRDSLVVDAIKNSKNNFDMVVVDEVHRCKNPSSEQGKNLISLSKVGKYHFGLTGTLLVNNPLDAFTPLKFINEERASFTNFKKYYCEMGGRFSKYQVTGFKNLDELKNEIGACSLHRCKDLLNLPPKIIIPEYIEMDSSHEKFYNDIKEGVVAEADRVNIRNTSLLGLTVRLRQASTCPEVLTTSKITNTKIERCCDLVEEVTSNGDKVIIYSTFKDPLYNLNSLLSKYKPLMCTGDQSEAEINNNRDNFQNNPDCKVILCTTQKMGTGFTLTAASYVIFLDAPWTYADFSQACDRAHRIGTTKSTIIYNLIAKGTIDEKVQHLIDLKRDVADYMVNDKTVELKYLLGVSELL